MSSESNEKEEESSVPSKGTEKRKRIHKQPKGRDISKEYKKNICGYITKRIARESLKDEYN